MEEWNPRYYDERDQWSDPAMAYSAAIVKQRQITDSRRNLDFSICIKAGFALGPLRLEVFNNPDIATVVATALTLRRYWWNATLPQFNHWHGPYPTRIDAAKAIGDALLKIAWADLPNA